MTRNQLEHIIRAAGTIADTEDLVVIGSQAVLGQFPATPAELLVSNEADVFPSRNPERSDLIDSTIGEVHRFSASSDITLTASVKRPRSCLPDGVIA
jgi:hypothetical protein